jgi:FYVE/RhoGEF/PH domain-containing protein 5/6
VQIERASQPREREFLLFSDCLVWLANANTGAEGDWGIGVGWSGTNTNTNSPVNGGQETKKPRAPAPMMRTRSKSEAELSLLRDQTRDATPTPTPGTSPPLSMPSSPSKRAHANAQKRYSLHPPVPAPQPRRHPSDGAAEERWMYKGRAELVDLEIIASVGVGGGREGEAYGEGGERRFEVLGPEGSFVVYAGKFRSPYLPFFFSFCFRS